jgi:chromosome segregation ATPase
MPAIETMTLEEIEATMAALRIRRKALTVNQRKIVTLARRRERLLQQVNALDEQISRLRGETTSAPIPAASAPRRRGRPPKSAVAGC